MTLNLRQETDPNLRKSLHWGTLKTKFVEATGGSSGVSDCPYSGCNFIGYEDGRSNAKLLCNVICKCHMCIQKHIMASLFTVSWQKYSLDRARFREWTSLNNLTETILILKCWSNNSISQLHLAVWSHIWVKPIRLIWLIVSQLRYWGACIFQALLLTNITAKLIWYCEMLMEKNEWDKKVFLKIPGQYL